jgi:hypothetical protein
MMMDERFTDASMHVITPSIVICACHMGTGYPRGEARSSRKTSFLLDAWPRMHVCASERHVVSQICIALIELVASFAHPSHLLHYEEPTSGCSAHIHGFLFDKHCRISGAHDNDQRDVFRTGWGAPCGSPVRMTTSGTMPATAAQVCRVSPPEHMRLAPWPRRRHIPSNLVVAPRASHNTLDLSMRYPHHVFLRANGI